MSDGFICSECSKTYSFMWGDICNECRAEEKQHQEVLTTMLKEFEHVTGDWGRYGNGIASFLRNIWVSVGL